MTYYLVYALLWHASNMTCYLHVTCILCHACYLPVTPVTCAVRITIILKCIQHGFYPYCMQHAYCLNMCYTWLLIIISFMLQACSDISHSQDFVIV